MVRKPQTPPPPVLSYPILSFSFPPKKKGANFVRRQVWYNASKAAVTNASLALAAEYGPQGIRVNAIAPLISGTGLFEAFAGVPYTEENIKGFVAQVPLGRLTDPLDVANAALFLASDEAAFVTGQNLVVDGGKGI